MKIIILVFAFLVFSVPLMAQTSYVNTFATVSYDSGTNQVTGYAYTEPAYVNAMYYNTYVNGSIRNFAGTDLDYDQGMGGGGSAAEINLSAAGNGCDYYQITTSHFQVMYYWVTDYWYNGQYWTGYWDEYYYNYFNGDTSSEPGGVYIGGTSYFGPGPAYSTYSDHIIFGNVEQWGSGSCSLAPEIRELVPNYGVPGVERAVDIVGNGFDENTTVETNSGSVTVGTKVFQHDKRITVALTPAATMTQGTFNVNVDNSGTNSNTEPFEVRVPHHMRVITDNRTDLPQCQTGYLTPKLRQFVLEIQDTNNNPVGPVPMKENFATLTTNTCRADGQGPSPDACEIDMLDYEQGRILDSITVHCNTVGGSCGYDIAGEWLWCPKGQAAVKLGTLNSNVRHNGITTNGYGFTSSMANTNVAP